MNRVRKYLVLYLSSFFMLCLTSCMPTSELVKSEELVKTGAEKSSSRAENEKQLVIWQVPETTKYSQDLKQRVMQYWSQFVKREWAKNYEMETPLNRQSILLESYQAYFRGGWVADHVVIQSLKQSNEQDDSLVAAVSIQYRNMATKMLQRHSVQDRWQKVDNKWHHVFYDPFINLSTRK